MEKLDFNKSTRNKYNYKLKLNYYILKLDSLKYR